MLVSLGKIACTLVFNLLYVYTVELYPTVVRAVASSTANFFARLASIIAPVISQLVSASLHTLLWRHHNVFLVRETLLGCFSEWLQRRVTTHHLRSVFTRSWSAHYCFTGNYQRSSHWHAHLDAGRRKYWTKVGFTFHSPLPLSIFPGVSGLLRAKTCCLRRKHRHLLRLWRHHPHNGCSNSRNCDSRYSLACS